MDIEDYRKKIEQDILDIMEKRLLEGEMDAKRAHEIAITILDTLRPHLTLDQIYKVALAFEVHFPELVPAVLPVVTNYNEKVKTIVTAEVDKLIQSGNIDQALNLLKKATKQ